MTYKGFYKPVNPLKYQGDADNIVFRSMWERHCFKWLDLNPDVVSWSSEEVVIPYYFPLDKRYHRYFVDLKYTTKSGKTFLIEVKPQKETRVPEGSKKTARYIKESVTYVKNQCKWQAAQEYAESKGWQFDVWTEQHLYKLGIMTKPLKPVGKMNALKVRKKK